MFSVARYRHCHHSKRPVGWAITPAPQIIFFHLLCLWAGGGGEGGRACLVRPLPGCCRISGRTIVLSGGIPSPCGINAMATWGGERWCVGAPGCASSKFTLMHSCVAHGSPPSIRLSLIYLDSYAYTSCTPQLRGKSEDQACRCSLLSGGNICRQPVLVDGLSGHGSH